MATKHGREQLSPIKKKFISPVSQRRPSKGTGISPKFRTNLKEFHKFTQQSKKGELGPRKKFYDKQKERPIRFHLGGNSHDPLNLNSLIDRDPAFNTPQASPLAKIHGDSPVEVFLPQDCTDPLNLKCFPTRDGKEVLITPKKKKKKKHKVGNNDTENKQDKVELKNVESKEEGPSKVKKRKRQRKRKKKSHLKNDLNGEVLEKKEKDPSKSNEKDLNAMEEVDPSKSNENKLDAMEKVDSRKCNEKELDAIAEVDPSKSNVKELNAMEELDPSKINENKLDAMEKVDPSKSNEKDLDAMEEVDPSKSNENKLDAMEEVDLSKINENKLDAMEKVDPSKSNEKDLDAMEEVDPSKGNEEDLDAVEEVDPSKSNENKLGAMEEVNPGKSNENELDAMEKVDSRKSNEEDLDAMEEVDPITSNEKDLDAMKEVDPSKSNENKLGMEEVGPSKRNEKDLDAMEEVHVDSSKSNENKLGAMEEVHVDSSKSNENKLEAMEEVNSSKRNEKDLNAMEEVDPSKTNEKEFDAMENVDPSMSNEKDLDGNEKVDSSKSNEKELDSKEKVQEMFVQEKEDDKSEDESEPPTKKKCTESLDEGTTSAIEEKAFAKPEKDSVKGFNVSKLSQEVLEKEKKPQVKHNDKEKAENTQKQSWKKKRKDNNFMYGNYKRYYGYRTQFSPDVRLKSFKKEWFKGKDVLDIGCNAGHLTLAICQEFEPRIILGIDIDHDLIKKAQKNVRHYANQIVTVTTSTGADFPVSFALTNGPLIAPIVPKPDCTALQFLQNVFFQQENYTPYDEIALSNQRPIYDTILCLSVTKWVHLNWGDRGLKLMLRRIFRNLRPGGRLILEPQPFSSYHKRRNLTEKISANYDNIKFTPEKFIDYLLSEEVGFAAYEVLEQKEQKAAGFRRPMYLFTKAPKSSNFSVEDMES